MMRYLTVVKGSLCSFNARFHFGLHMCPQAQMLLDLQKVRLGSLIFRVPSE